MRTDTLPVMKAAKAFWSRFRGKPEEDPEPEGIGLALGGGFARGIAHIGVLRVLERERIPIRWIAGVSAGSIVATGFAGGSDSYELERVARSMKFRDVAGWKLSKLGLVASEKMEAFLRRALPVHSFEKMKIPLAVVATDLCSGEPVIFRDSGEVFTAVRASCSYPGLFQPVKYQGRHLVDGAMSMEIPAAPLRALGVSKVVSVALPHPLVSADPSSVFGVVHRCFQIMQRRTEHQWRSSTDVVIAPEVRDVAWDDFSNVERMIAAGEKAAEAVLPMLRESNSRRPANHRHHRSEPFVGRVPAGTL